MRTRGTVIAAVLVASALLLSGCGLIPSASSTGGGSTGGSTGENGAATSGPADPGEASLPDTFPTSDVPLIEGDIAYAQDLGTGWVVYIYRDDYLGGYEEAKGLLLDAGFSGDTVGKDDKNAFGQFTSAQYTVNLQGADDGNSFGKTVGYTVVKTG